MRIVRFLFSLFIIAGVMGLALVPHLFHRTMCVDYTAILRTIKV